MNNVSTFKAVRATITLGDINIDVFQVTDANYYLFGYEFLAGIAQRDKSILSNKKSPYHLKALIGKTPDYQNVKIEGINLPYKGLPVEDIILAIGGLSKLGHTEATNILMACASEALERRADNAFNVLRTEQERNERLKSRMNGKITRRTLTDAIKDYLERHPELSPNQIKFIYGNVSDCLNRKVLGHRASNAKLLLEISKNDSLRDHLSADALIELDHIENLAMRYIDGDDMAPLQAMKLACELGKVKLIGIAN